MLKQRIITALTLLPLLLAAIALLPTPLLALVLGLAILLAAHEWATLIGIRGVTYLAAMALLVGGVALSSGQPWIWLPVFLTCAWWVWMVRWIAIYPAGFDATHPPRWVFAGAGLVVIPGTIAAVVLLHGAPQGTWKLLFALFIVFAADVGAYFAGRGFGRRKLSPRVSPGKTWEGAVGGWLLSLVIAVPAGLWLFRVDGAAWIGFLLLCAAIVAVSIIGDLGESLMKRQVGAKDSGKLLPGHGGLLDRIDSLLAALPATAVGLKGLGL